MTKKSLFPPAEEKLEACNFELIEENTQNTWISSCSCITLNKVNHNVINKINKT